MCVTCWFFFFFFFFFLGGGESLHKKKWHSGIHFLFFVSTFHSIFFSLFLLFFFIFLFLFFPPRVLGLFEQNIGITCSGTEPCNDFSRFTWDSAAISVTGLRISNNLKWIRYYHQERPSCSQHRKKALGSPLHRGKL